MLFDVVQQMRLAYGHTYQVVWLCLHEVKYVLDFTKDFQIFDFTNDRKPNY